ncbi:MAG: TIM barrel protein [Bacteroidota bacterium]
MTAITPQTSIPKQGMDRRTFLQQSSALTAAMVMPTFPSKAKRRSRKMGVSVASYAIRWRSRDDSKTYPGFANALELLEHCHHLGAGGVQVGVRNWTEDFAGKIRDKREALDLYLEGQISLPKTEQEADSFETEVKRAKEAGAKILRTVCLSGRRYESFPTLESFQSFKRSSIQSLEWTETIMARHHMKLAVENHKDWRVPELLEILKHLDSEWIGVTLDTGNNISLLEDPMAVVEALAPYTMTTHFKDMAFEEYEEGFLLSEVPLGQGVLDLNRVIDLCLEANPEVTFNLEMITRDPLKIPCLKDSYWETFEDLPGQDLAHTLKAVRQFDSPHAMPDVSNKSSDEKLAFEEQNVKKSFQFAQESLGLK